MAFESNPTFDPASRAWIAGANRRMPGALGGEPDVREVSRAFMDGTK